MKTIAFILCFILSFPFLVSQEKYNFDFQIDSEVFETQRKFYVHVHEDYYSSETDSFGVIYVLDAQASSFYNNAKSIIDYLVWSNQISPMIVVGIHSESRYKEFIPLDRTLPLESSENIGEAEKLRAHIEQEIFPRIKNEFKVNEFKAIIGHSRGGAFIAGTLFSDKKDLFNAYIAISPGMHYVNNQILQDAQRMISEGADFHKFYFCTYGTVGSLEKRFKPQVEFLDSLFNAHPNSTIGWKKMELAGKTHWGVVAPSIAEGIIEMNRAYQADQFLIEKFASQEELSMAEQILAYQQQQEKKLRYTFGLNAYRLRRYGDEFSELENYRRALELYDLSLSINKNDLNTYLRKASVYRELQDIEKAENVYHEALKMIELNENQFDENELEESRKRVMQKLENMRQDNH